MRCTQGDLPSAEAAGLVSDMHCEPRGTRGWAEIPEMLVRLLVGRHVRGTLLIRQAKAAASGEGGGKRDEM